MTSGPLSLDEHSTELYFAFYRLADNRPTFLDPRIGRLEMRKVLLTLDFEHGHHITSYTDIEVKKLNLTEDARAAETLYYFGDRETGI